MAHTKPQPGIPVPLHVREQSITVLGKRSPGRRERKEIAQEMLRDHRNALAAAFSTEKE